MTRKIALTDLAIKRQQPPEKGRIELWDAKIPGFGLRLSASGQRSFVLVYRFGNRPRRMTLGRYPDLSLSEGRAKALAARTAIAHGRDPGHEKTETRIKEETLRYDVVVTRFISEYARPKNRSWQTTERLLRSECKPWQARRLDSITANDVRAILLGIKKRGHGTTANRTHAALRKLFNWSVELGLLDDSPVAGIKAPSPNNTRDCVIPDTDLAAIWQGAEEMGYPFGSIVQLLILTGQRRDEVVGLRWGELSEGEKLWHLPAERNKSKRAHTLPLTARMLSTLQALPKQHAELVFPAASIRNRDRGQLRPLSGFGYYKRRLNELAGVTDWTLHDLRRTAATRMAQLKVPPHIVSRILNHSPTAIHGVTAIYNRFGYLDEMLEALEKWERHVSGLLMGSESAHSA